MRVEIEIKEIRAELRGISKPFTTRDGAIFKRLEVEVPSNKMETGAMHYDIYITEDTVVEVEKDENGTLFVWVYYDKARNKFRLLQYLK